MKLEYLPDGSPDCPLIRLYEFTPSEAQKLLNIVTALASGEMTEVALHELPEIRPINDCRLTLFRQSWDQGILRDRDGFWCGLTAGSWDNVAGLIEPFVHSAAGFQWLSQTPDEVNFLISGSGSW